MMKQTILLASFAVASNAFEFPTLPNVFKPPSSTASPLKSLSLPQKKKELLDAISFTSNGKTATPEKQSEVLQIVGEIEASTLPPSLSDPDVAKKLDGVWYLQYTSPSVVGDNDEFPDAWKPDCSRRGALQDYDKANTVQRIRVGCRNHCRYLEPCCQANY